MDIIEYILPFLENEHKIQFVINKQCLQLRNQSFTSYPYNLKYETCIPVYIWDLIYKIDFSFTSMKELPTLPKQLKVLRCNHNYVSELPELPNLIELNVSYNCLVELPRLPSSLKKLYCSNNFLIRLPYLPDHMLVISLQNNDFFELPPIPPDLKLLICNMSQHNKFGFTVPCLFV